MTDPHPNNFKMPGTKLTSRFGMSHRQARAAAKYFAPYAEPGPKGRPFVSKRLAKKCTHPNMVDDGYGGPESGRMAGHCPRCGFSFHHTLY